MIIEVDVKQSGEQALRVELRAQTSFYRGRHDHRIVEIYSGSAPDNFFSIKVNDHRNSVFARGLEGLLILTRGPDAQQYGRDRADFDPRNLTGAPTLRPLTSLLK